MGNKFNLDLDAAWSRVLSEAWTDQVPDVLRWQDHKVSWPEIKKDIEERLDNDDFLFQQPVLMQMPKDGFVTRPMTVLNPTDRAVYEAVVDLFIERIEASLPSQVRAMRINPKKKSKSRMRKQPSEWAKFQEAGRDLYLSGKEWLLTTDITAYFQYIEINRLVEDLKTLGCEEEIVNLLSKLLNTLERTSHVWGLPQGPTASSILGNFFLLPADRVLMIYTKDFLRYQDDIKMLDDNPVLLKKALQELEEVLRFRRLNLSVHKTKLLHGEAALEELEDARKDAIVYGLKIKDPSAPEELRKLFDDAVSEEPVKARDVRFSVVRLADLGDDHAVPWILDHFSEVPYLASHLVEYLGKYVTERPEIEERVRGYLSNPDENIYPWAEMQLLRMVARAQQISDESFAASWRILRDAGKHTLVREHAARCVGRHARSGYASLLKDMFNSSSDLRLKRALLVACTEARGKAGPDRSWLGTVAASTPELAQTAKYLRSVTSLPPP